MSQVLPQKSSTFRERFRTFAFGARSFFQRRSKNKMDHGTVDDVQDRRTVCPGESHAFTHVREGHAPVDVAHTRMARRRTNQYRAIPGVHPNRPDPQSASSLSTTNHTFRCFGTVNYVSSTEEKHRLNVDCIRARKLSSSPVAKSQRGRKSPKGRQ